VHGLIKKILAVGKERFLSGAVNAEILLHEMHSVAVDMLHSFVRQVEVLTHFRVLLESF
jgi:hypothetical protein